MKPCEGIGACGRISWISLYPKTQSILTHPSPYAAWEDNGADLDQEIFICTLAECRSWKRNHVAIIVSGSARTRKWAMVWGVW
jgi:hypothetical protein